MTIFFYTKPERITGSVSIFIVDVCLLRIPFANTIETPLKQLRETLFFSKRYEFTYKYKKLIGKKKRRENKKLTSLSMSTVYPLH